MAVVLVAALAHASWNALIKAGRDKMHDTVAIAVGGAVLALLVLPFVPLPAPAAWPWLIASMVIHQAYLLLVANAYRTGDLSLAYPLMRGLAPVLVTAGSGTLLGEQLSSTALMGIALVASGLLLLAVVAARHARKVTLPLAFALTNALVIAGYTVVDGIGVRLSGHAVAYVSWNFVLNALPILALHLFRRGGDGAALLLADWKKALVGGGCSYLAYGLALWAMTVAPVAMVAALRETSIVFATGIAALLLREPVGKPRLLAVLVVTAGAVVMKLG